MEIRILETHTVSTVSESPKTTVESSEVGYQPRAAMMMILLQSVFLRHEKALKKYSFNMLRCLFKESKRELSVKSTRESSFRSFYMMKRSFLSSRSLSPHFRPKRNPRALRKIVSVLNSLAKIQCKKLFRLFKAAKSSENHNKKVLFRTLTQWTRVCKQRKRITEQKLKTVYRILNAKILNRYRLAFSNMNIRQIPLPYNIHDYIDDILLAKRSTPKLEYSKSKLRNITSPTRWRPF